MKSKALKCIPVCRDTDVACQPGNPADHRAGIDWLRFAAIGALTATLVACGGVDGPVSDAGSAEPAPSSPTVALEKPVAPHTAAEPLPPLSASAVIQPGIVESHSTTGIRARALPAAARSPAP